MDNDADMEKLGEEIAESVVRDAYALGLSAPAEVRAAIEALATAVAPVVPELSDRYAATYVTGIYRYFARERGESDAELAANLWSTFDLIAGGGEGARVVARELVSIRAVIETGGHWRSVLES